MSIGFSIEAVKEKSKNRTMRGKKGSKYEPIVTAFLESDHQLGRVDGTGKRANNLALNLNKLIKKRGDSVKVSIRNGEVYLEKNIT
jgi:hypothetical protein